MAKQERVVFVGDVKRVQTSGGNIRYVLTDESGEKYSTFHERIGDRAESFIGRRARIAFHENKRGNYVNVYLDAVEEAGEPANTNASTNGVSASEQVGWSAAIEAAPWLVGDPERPIKAPELFEKLKDFKDRVAEDVRNTSSGSAKRSSKSR